MAPVRRLSQRMQHAVPLVAVGSYVFWVARDRFEAHHDRRKELDEKRAAKKEKEREKERERDGLAAAALAK